MADIELYTFEDENGEPDGWTTYSPDEAREYAQAHHLRWIANTYEWADSEEVADYTRKRKKE